MFATLTCILEYKYKYSGVLQYKYLVLQTQYNLQVLYSEYSTAFHVSVVYEHMTYLVLVVHWQSLTGKPSYQITHSDYIPIHINL